MKSGETQLAAASRGIPAGSLAALIALTILSGCGQGSSSSESSLLSSGSRNGVSLPAMTGPNVLKLTVNGSTCSTGSYVNKPCVSVTICSPGGASNCQTITDILLDTGSSGLRVFKSVLNPGLSASLVPLSSGGGQVAECMQYGDGSATWGSVARANVVLGSESAVEVPVQVIDSTFGTPPSSCGTPNAGPSDSNAGYNGILGVGLFGPDCGAGCSSQSGNQLYFSCIGSQCSGIALAENLQVQNPVSLLPKDNNGIIVRLPAVSPGGVMSADGYVVLGIGTESNNMPSGVTTFPADPNTGEFSTSYNGKTYNSILDSGSNAYFVPASAPASLPKCTEDPSWYCPASLIRLSATNIGSSGSVQQSSFFDIGNFAEMLTSPNHVFVELGGSSGNISGGGLFDWGLPFYLGRDIYVGIEGKASKLGIGPYWAY